MFKVVHNNNNIMICIVLILWYVYCDLKFNVNIMIKLVLIVYYMNIYLVGIL